MINWQQIDTLFLDMDGTLLDLHFDNLFWLHYVPAKYAALHGISEDESRRKLHATYDAIRGTINWYSVDYWSDELQLDIAMLKHEIAHLIAVHPHVVTFLQAMQQLPTRVILLTNAHMKSLQLKMEKTKLHGYFDAIICAHDLGVPKEDSRFWPLLQQYEAYNKQRTLLVDDSKTVLHAAEEYGVKWLLGISMPDSKKDQVVIEGMNMISNFQEITPHLQTYGAKT